MKKLITFICVAALAAGMGNKAHAQFFDFDGAENFHLIWLDEATEQYWEITDRIAQDLRINGTYGTPNVGERFLDVWENTFTFGEANGKGALDQIGNYLNCIATNPGWAGGGFQLIPEQGSAALVDLTSITEDYRFHMAVKKMNTAACRINLIGGGKPDPNNPNGPYVYDDTKGAHFIVGEGNHVYDDPVLTNLTPVFTANTWLTIDIPVSELRDMGWNNRSTFKGYYFSFEFGNVRPNDLMFDAVFYYQPLGTGINGPEVKQPQLQVLVTKNIVEVVNAEAPLEVYDITGKLVKTVNNNIFGADELSKGAYIIKSGNQAAKTIIR
jgi:hypothetical protein